MSTVEGSCQHAYNLLTYCKNPSTGQKGVVDRSEILISWKKPVNSPN